ncbi:glycosyl transferase family 2 [Oceanisphaera profunda]|uniref:Glycosyl transferase family 2 n=1 Tax=Oceanisphaera profunda TaxID=1416627 RepID=A0A1Y0D7A0_9GAMM|nr:VWA domain-containing protein [Oceanisphaera profunda]ART83423.1 glycosyl transferase family 2 [Oceanisphaera profunda]
MSYDLILANDLIENPSARCAVTMVLDTSASMSGSPIQQLNEGFQLFLNTLSEDEVAAYSVDVSVITAGGQVEQRLPFTSLSSIDNCEQFSANGMTPLGGAVDLALAQLEARKQQYKANGVAYYQPWLVIISDGEPNDNWRAAAAKARDLSANRKLVSLVIGVAGADMQILGEFSNRPAIGLQGVKFKEFFTWLSASMSRVSASSSTSAGVNLPPMDSWASI